MTNKKDNSKSRSWNTQNLVKLSQRLGEAFLPGLDIGKSDKKADSLTMAKFLEMKRNKERS